MSSLTLQWQGDLKFATGAGSPSIELHSSTPGVASPTQALAYAVMACMAMDVVYVLQKGRHDLQALSVTFDWEFLRVAIAWVLCALVACIVGLILWFVVDALTAKERPTTWRK